MRLTFGDAVGDLEDGKPSEVRGLGAVSVVEACVNHDPVPCVYFFAGPVVTGLVCEGDMGREKLRGLLFILSISSASTTLDNRFACLEVPAGGGGGGGVTATRSALDPRLPSCGVGEVIRFGGSKLDDLLCVSRGSAGTGGTSEPGVLGDIVPFV